MKRLTEKFRVCIITGTRAEFGIWRPVLHAIQASRTLDLQLVATGMHLLHQFGNTANDISAQGFALSASAPMYADNEPPAQSLARGIENLAAAFRGLRPSILMVLGDRLEMLAAACAALAERIPVGHVHGGETAPGIWDEQIRHAITKMAHLHFCATETARRRILQMGEDKRRVNLVGAPALDLIEAFWESRARHRVQRDAHDQKALLLLHPSGGTSAEEQARTELILTVLKKRNLSFECIGPNNDPGHEGILEAYQRAGVPLMMSQSQEEFWETLLSSCLLIGNSSAGIIEAASLALPVVNIGPRQSGRERNPNVLDAPFKAAAIDRAITRALSDNAFKKRVHQRKNLYGKGTASAKIVKALEAAAAQGIPLVKKFHDKM